MSGGQQRKRVDDRIRTLIENGIHQRHRSFFVLVGDHGKDQVVNLHYILSKAQVKARPSVLWCYKKELGFSTHRKKRMRQLKRAVARGMKDPNTEDPFELFVSSTNIRWCYYKESHKILGSTYGMLVLQDFEAITPNLMARTIETVEGGGIVVLLLRTMTSLKQLYGLTMDVHSRFRTESHKVVVPRFNERFLLSLATLKMAAVCDDELNILPISKHIAKIQPCAKKMSASSDGFGTKSITLATNGTEDEELSELKESLQETQPVGTLVGMARTLDQAHAILTFTESISEKSLRSTVSLTASRGRGKSAALGMAVASAVAYGYSNIFVTAPTPENLQTMFEFILKALEELKYSEHTDYEVIQSTNPEFNKAIVRINIFRDHRQTVQYIQPGDCQKLTQAELLVIDEAAAIPLPIVRKLLGKYLVFISSTINGYEGTGRSLSLKLLNQLRKQQSTATQAAAAAAKEIKGNYKGVKKGERKVHEERWKVASETAAKGAAVGGGRILREVTLDVPIRYAQGDPVEAWLNKLLCLDVTEGSQRLVCGCPAPQDCQLYYVNRDALFSHHKLSEAFLQRMMALYVASHYKNTPNDLQLMSDAPAHHLFILLGPAAESEEGGSGIPDILCVMQVAIEGELSKESIRMQTSRGMKPSGDLIPWIVAQQFQDDEFATLSGARVVRIATHPDVMKMGYGTRALELLTKYYQGELSSPDINDEGDTADVDDDEEEEDMDTSGGGILKEKVKPRKKLPPLLVDLQSRKAERLHWLGTSFGLTEPLFNFWRKASFLPVYIRQTRNDVTGEHSTVMIRALNCDDLPESPKSGWLTSLGQDTQRRLLSLFAFEFKHFPTSLALSLACACRQTELSVKNGEQLSTAEFGMQYTAHDLKRLHAYSKNLVDFHLVVDLLPALVES